MAAMQQLAMKVPVAMVATTIAGSRDHNSGNDDIKQDMKKKKRLGSGCLLEKEVKITVLWALLVGC